MNTEKMGRFIAERRKDKHMTQKDFARMLNITDKAVSKWERGISCPDISLLPSVADILGVTIHELLNGEQSNTEPEGPAAGRENALQYADSEAEAAAGAERQRGAITIFSAAVGRQRRMRRYQHGGFRQTHLGAFSHCLYGFRLACVLPRPESR